MPFISVNLSFDSIGCLTFPVYTYILTPLNDWAQMENEGINSSVADKAVIAKEIHIE